MRSSSTGPSHPRSSSARTARTRWSARTSACRYGRRALAIRGYAPTPPDRRGTQVIRYGDRRQPAYAWAFDRGDGLLQRRVRRAAPRGRARVTHRRGRCCSTSSSSCCPARSTPASTGRATTCPLSGWRWEQPDGRLLLAGDAAGLINPMTGEGIYYAVATGIAAGRAAVRALRDGPGDAGAAAPAGGPRPARHATSSTPSSPPGSRSTRPSSTAASGPPAATSRSSTSSSSSGSATAGSPAGWCAGWCPAWRRNGTSSRT